MGTLQHDFGKSVAVRIGRNPIYIWEYFNSSDVLAASTTQSQILDHSTKVHSFPLRYRFEKHAHTIMSPTPTTIELSFSCSTTLSLIFRDLRGPVLEMLQRALAPVQKVVNTLFDRDYALNDYYHEMHTSKFVASPRGVGVDCYRNYESFVFWVCSCQL